MKVILIIILVLFVMICGFISLRQFQEKGFLFNNAYIYASKQERETMDKSPHYRQSAIVFLLLAVVWLCILLEVCLEMPLFQYLSWIVTVITLVYAIVSSVLISKK